MRKSSVQPRPAIGFPYLRTRRRGELSEVVNRGYLALGFFFFGGGVGAGSWVVHFPHVPPPFAQCLQYLQFLHTRQSLEPVQPRGAARAGSANIEQSNDNRIIRRMLIPFSILRHISLYVGFRFLRNMPHSQISETLRGIGFPGGPP